MEWARHIRHQRLHDAILSGSTSSPEREPATSTTATPRPNPRGATSPTVPSTPETLPRPALAVATSSKPSSSTDLSSLAPGTASPDTRSLSDFSGEGAPTNTENRLSAHDNDAPCVITHEGKSYTLWCNHCEARGVLQPGVRTLTGFQNHLLKVEGCPPGTVPRARLIELYGREINTIGAGDSTPPHSGAMSPSSQEPSDGQARSHSPLLGSNSERV